MTMLKIPAMASTLMQVYLNRLEQDSLNLMTTILNSPSSQHLTLSLSASPHSSLESGDTPAASYSSQLTGTRHWVQANMTQSQLQALCLDQIHAKCTVFLLVTNPNDRLVDAIV